MYEIRKRIRDIMTEVHQGHSVLWPASLSSEVLTLSSTDRSAVSKTQIFTVPCLPSKHPSYMTHLFNYASFLEDKKSNAGSRPSCEHFPPTTVEYGWL